MKDVYIEIGDDSLESLDCDLQSEDQQGDDPCCFKTSNFPLGTVSMFQNQDCLIAPKFSISLKNITRMQEGQIVVGRVVKGLDVLPAVDALGSKFGKPVKRIVAKNLRIL